MPNELKPCPFCGSKKIEVKRLSKRCFFVGCENSICEVFGPSKLTPKAAIEAWNRRAGEE